MVAPAIVSGRVHERTCGGLDDTAVLQLGRSARGPARVRRIPPVAMVGGTIDHVVIIRNLNRLLDTGLRSSQCLVLSQDAGFATAGGAVRYPDALVACSKQDGRARLVENVVSAFEVVSPTSGRNDRIVKAREYATVPSFRRYVIVESTATGVLCLSRASADAPWTATALTREDTLDLPEINMQLAVADLYEDVALPD